MRQNAVSTGVSASVSTENYFMFYIISMIYIMLLCYYLYYFIIFLAFYYFLAFFVEILTSCDYYEPQAPCPMIADAPWPIIADINFF